MEDDGRYGGDLGRNVMGVGRRTNEAISGHSPTAPTRGSLSAGPTAKRVGISVVGEAPLVARLHEVFPREKFRLRAYLARESPLRQSDLLDEVITIGRGKRLLHSEIIEAFLSDVLVADDWVVFGDDDVLKALASSGGSEEKLVGLLPVKRFECRQILGSKAGLAELCMTHGIPHPTSRIFASESHLSEHLASRIEPAVVKGDSGGGGRTVFIWKPGDNRWRQFLQPAWFPVVVQDFVQGPLVAVEALFREGRLVGAVHSDVTRTVSPLSQSSARHFRQARSRDYLETLQKVAHGAGLHGFANTSFLWDEAENRHLLFELDLRPNSWHQFGPRLGMDWAKLMTTDLADFPQQLEKVQIQYSEAIVRLYPREIDFALRQRRLGPIVPWLRRDPGTWQWRQRRDRVVNRLERRSVMRALIQALGLGRLLRHRPPAHLPPK